MFRIVTQSLNSVAMNEKSYIEFFVVSSQIVPTAHVIPTTDSSQGKPIAPVVPSQAVKQVAKQVRYRTLQINKISTVIFMHVYVLLSLFLKNFSSRQLQRHF